MNSFDGYVIVDVETTGLDPVLDDILELGILIADKNFNILGEFSKVRFFDFELEGHGIDPFVVDMHTKNGLWKECQNSTLSLSELQIAAVDFLRDGGWNNQPMCGSTVQFDRSFIAQHMAKLNDTFHYRHIDVSSFKNVFNKYNWTVRTITPAAKIHRSLSDCHDTLDELKSYVTGINYALQEQGL